MLTLRIHNRSCHVFTKCYSDAKALLCIQFQGWVWGFCLPFSPTTTLLRFYMTKVQSGEGADKNKKCSFNTSSGVIRLARAGGGGGSLENIKKNAEIRNATWWRYTRAKSPGLMCHPITRGSKTRYQLVKREQKGDCDARLATAAVWRLPSVRT